MADPFNQQITSLHIMYPVACCFISFYSSGANRAIYICRMKKMFPALALICVVVNGCLFYANPSENPPRTFMKSLAKHDGSWTLTQLSLIAYDTDPFMPGAAPVIDTVYLNTGTFHFDNYNGDIDGTGSFTVTSGTESNFTFKVPDFDETMKQSPEMSIFFNGYPVMICNGNDYKEADTYTLTGQVTDVVTTFPLVQSIPAGDYQLLEFTIQIKRN